MAWFWLRTGATCGLCRHEVFLSSYSADIPCNVGGPGSFLLHASSVIPGTTVSAMYPTQVTGTWLGPGHAERKRAVLGGAPGLWVLVTFPDLTSLFPMPFHFCPGIGVLSSGGGGVGEGSPSAPGTCRHSACRLSCTGRNSDHYTIDPSLFLNQICFLNQTEIWPLKVWAEAFCSL